MKTGKSLVELAKELERIKSAARDFVVPVEKLQAEAIGDRITDLDGAPIQGRYDRKVKLSFSNGTKHSFGLNPWSASQLAGYTDIPKAYFDRIHEENPGLLADNINHGLEKITAQARKEGAPASRMVRTLDGNVRGLLSSRYRILDAHDMLESVFPVIADKGMQVVSSEVTERRLFIKALSPKLTAEVKKGDVVQHGLVISTSDVGAGSVRVEPFIFRLVCLNGMISNTAIRRFHVGKNQAEEDIRELLSDRTRELSDSAFWSQVRDVVLGSLKPENFEREVDRLRLAADLPIKNLDLPRVVELTMKATGLTGEGKKNGILAALASGNEGAGLTQWGLINSITRAAQADDVSYEASIEMERAAGAVLELPRRSWEVIAASA
jgi:Domain of unknown function (DUF932)